jgi:glycosyltransferase involved in cell wall biosynthesis
MIAPLISVAMPVHNASPFLARSIDSILSQSFKDFEFVILDDGSTDGSGAVVREWAQRDSRIRFYEGRECLGLSGSSNYVVSKCLAPIVARMDADDISHNDRLQRQWQVIQNEVDVIAVGTLCVGIDANGRQVRPRDRWRIVRRSRYIPFPHGSAMFRKKTFEEIGGYRSDLKGGEDQDLFLRMTAKGRVVTLPDVLYSYRYHVHNSTLHNGTHAVQHGHSANDQDLAAFHMLAAMRLWAGHNPMILRPMLACRSLRWNLRTAIAFASAGWGSLHPPSLRGFLRGFIRTRDFLAGLQLKEGIAYEWRSE